MSEAKFRKLPLTRGYPKCMIHKITRPHYPPKFVFSLKSRRIISCSPEAKNPFLKNTLIICRVWRNAISSEMFYISSKMNEISSKKLEIFCDMFEFLCKMLNISSKVFKNCSEYSIIRRKNTEIYQKKILKNAVIIGFNIRKSGR